MITYFGLTISIGAIIKYQYDITQLDGYILDAVTTNVDIKFPNVNNVIIYGSLFGPEFDNKLYENALEFAKHNKIDNLIIVSAGEYWCISGKAYIKFLIEMNASNVIRLGNFDNIPAELNFHFTWGVYSAEMWGHEYNTNELLLSNIKYKFINYNRDPKHYREELVNLIIEHNLDKHGIVTLGDNNRKNKLTFLNENMTESTHCYDKHMKLGYNIIPNDNSSLGTMEYWSHHFLNVVSETFFYHWDDIFITEKTAKPIIGLRPFIINGNWKTYKWLEDNGFKTFEKYFPFAKFRDLHEDDVHPNIIKVIKWVCEQENETLLKLYNDMLPDLLHNRERLFEFAKEEKARIKNILL